MRQRADHGCAWLPKASIFDSNGQLLSDCTHLTRAGLVRERRIAIGPMGGQESTHVQIDGELLTAILEKRLD
jgi:hypothetical protein